MEPIKDLDLVIAAGDQMVGFFRAFERLPRILEVIRTAQEMPASLKKEISDREAELRGLEGEVRQKVHDLDQTKDAIEIANSNLNALEGKLAENKKALLELMDRDVLEARKAANDKMQRSLKNMNEELELHKDTIKESEEKMIESIDFHKRQVDIYKVKEAEAKALSDEAMATLEKIKKSFE
jgi:chromosome segregation ATPase